MTGARASRTARLEAAYDTLEEAEDDVVTVSVKYTNNIVLNDVRSVSKKMMHLAFISRIVADAKAEDLLLLCDDPGTEDIEIIATSEKDSVLHRLLEIYRIYHYVIGGRYDVSVVNFSQGVRYEALGRDISAERTVSEALDMVSRRAAPVFVAAGNAGDLGLSGYSAGRYVIPVVATQDGGRALYPPTSRPDAKEDPNRLFLFADGAPRTTRSYFDALPTDQNSPRHLTLGQMLLPEESEIQIGGSSYAVFAATPTAALIHQYLQVTQFYMNACKPIGRVSAEPFISYYIDNPIQRDSAPLDNRLADRRNKFIPLYDISEAAKSRVGDFFFGNSVEINLKYSPPLLAAFYKSLPAASLAPGFEGHQRYVNQSIVLEKLRSMTFGDWIRIAANRRSLYYHRWLEKAEKDTEPMIGTKTMDQIAGYCQTATLFNVLPDVANGKF